MTEGLPEYPPVWRSLRLPLCPPSWTAWAPLDPMFTARGKAKGPSTTPAARSRQRQASGTPTTLTAWVAKATGAVTALRQRRTDYRMGRSVLAGHADRDDFAATIPLLSASRDILRAIGLPASDLIAWLCETTPLEMFDQLEASDDPRWPIAALDVPITAESWAPRTGSAPRSVIRIEPSTVSQEMRSLARARMDAAGMAKTLDYSDALAYLWGAGGEPTKLAAAAASVGLTRERIRQISEKVIEDVTEFDRQFPASTFDALDAEFANVMPDTRAVVERALALANGSHDFSLKSATNLARLRGGPPDISSPYWADPAHWAERNRQSHESRTAIRNAGRTAATKLGFTTLASLMDALSDQGFDETEVRGVLTNSPDWIVLPEGWLYLEASSTNTMRNCLARMFAVCAPLSVAELHAGLCRYVIMRQIEEPPPQRILAALLHSHPAFEVHGDLVEELEPRAFPHDTIQSEIVELLMTAPDRAMHRNEVIETLVRRGRNPTSVAMYLAYALTIKPCGSSVFCPIGHSIDDETVRLIRARARAIAVRGSVKTEVHGKTLTMTGILSTAVFTSGIIALSKAARALLNERHFDVYDAQGQPVGSAKAVASGPLVGLLTAISNMDLFPGDTFRLAIDLANGTAVLTAED